MASGDDRPGNRELADTFLASRALLARFIAARCRDDTVEDLVQELWIKVQRIDEPVDQPLSYLYRMAHNLVLDTRRGAARRLARDHHWDSLEGTGARGQAPDPERALIARERLGAVERALAATGERVLRIFRRFRVDGVSQKEIAAEFGVSLSTVEKDLRKAYDVLAQLRDQADDDAD